MWFFRNLFIGTQHPGRYGEMMTVIPAHWVAISLIFNPTPGMSPSLAVLVEQLGTGSCAIWMIMVGILPIVAIGLDNRLLRLIAGSVAMVTWLYLILVVSVYGTPLVPAVGGFMMCFFACLVAEFRLLRQIWMERQWRTEMHGPP